MPRCTECFSIVTKTDVDCYVCGQPLPDAPGKLMRALQRFWGPPSPKKVKKVNPAQAVKYRRGNASTAPR